MFPEEPASKDGGEEKVVEKIVEKPPLDSEGKPITAEGFAALQTKVDDLIKAATSHDSTAKERDVALKELTENKTRLETLESMISGKTPKAGEVSLKNVPEPTVFNETSQQWEYNPDWGEYQKLLGAKVVEQDEEIKRLRQVAGATGVQNVSHGNTIAKSEFMATHGLKADEMKEIIDLGVEKGIIQHYLVGDGKKAIIENVVQLEEARTFKLTQELQAASKKGDMKAVQEIVAKHYTPKTSSQSLRLGGSGDIETTDAEKKFQKLATQEMDIGELAEAEIDELIKKGYMSEHTKKYRWAKTQKT